MLVSRGWINLPPAEERTWGAHDHISVKRATSEEGKR